jgi:hypothetical protein
VCSTGRTCAERRVVRRVALPTERQLGDPHHAEFVICDETIEHRTHGVRDVTFGEDASRVRTDPIPQVLAALRNTVIGLLHATGRPCIKAATLDLQANPWEVLALLGIHPDN